MPPHPFAPRFSPVCLTLQFSWCAAGDSAPRKLPPGRPLCVAIPRRTARVNHFCTIATQGPQQRECPLRDRLPAMRPIAAEPKSMGPRRQPPASVVRPIVRLAVGAACRGDASAVNNLFLTFRHRPSPALLTSHPTRCRRAGDAARRFLAARSAAIKPERAPNPAHHRAGPGVGPARKSTRLYRGVRFQGPSAVGSQPP